MTIAQRQILSGDHLNSFQDSYGMLLTPLPVIFNCYWKLQAIWILVRDEGVLDALQQLETSSFSSFYLNYFSSFFPNFQQFEGRNATAT